jgi:hypothetical protein
MPDGSTPLAGHDVNRNDGNRIDLHARFAGRRERRRAVDLYSASDPKLQRVHRQGSLEVLW